jgi:hypothetical protein
MPAHFHQLSRGELEAVIAFLRGLPLEVSHFAWGEEGAGMDGMDP